MLSTLEGQITALRSPAVNVRATGYTASSQRGAAAIPAVEALLDDENPFIRARAVWVLARLGASGLDRVEALTRDADPRCASPPIARCGRWVMPCDRRQLATDPSPAVRREVALSLRDVPFDYAREILLALARGYDGKDRTYLEAWGIGATGKEEALYAALAATQTERDAAKWPVSYADLVWRLTPRAAVPALAARAGAATLPAAGAQQGDHGARIHTHAGSRECAARHGPARRHGHQAEPGAVVAHQLQGLALGGRRHRRGTQAARSL